MNVDKFGRIAKTRGIIGPKGPKGDQGHPGEKGNGFNVTESGEYDIQSHKLINCLNPETYHDVTNKIYVDEKVLQLVSSINSKLQSLEDRFQLKFGNTKAILHDADTATTTIVTSELSDQNSEDHLQIKFNTTTTDDIHKNYVNKKVETINADLEYLKTYVDEKVNRVMELLGVEEERNE